MMIDIRFYMAVAGLKKRLMSGEKMDRGEVFAAIEGMRNPDPVVYNIETTNACNMRCRMCPRTTMMTRKVEKLGMDAFARVVDQIRPWTAGEWSAWEDFAEREYGVPRGGESENHFFLFVIPKVIQLHGYGDPLLDSDMAARLALLEERRFPSYFSCNPSNIDIAKNLEMFENGLDFIKYSIETVDDMVHKQIRGAKSDFTESYRKILKLVEEKEKRKLGTRIVITMLNLFRTDQEEDYLRLRDAFKGIDVYVYLKSQDQQWYENKWKGTKSIHWTEFCQCPWSSVTIKSNGEAAMCMEDFNNEIILGDARTEPLAAIWNGARYAEFRRSHFDMPDGIKCTKQCDMKLLGEFFSGDCDGN